MAVAVLHDGGVRLPVQEAVDRQAEAVGGDLREAGLVALSIRLGAKQQRDLAVRFKTDFGALVRRAAGGFQKAGHADAAQQPTPPRLVAPSREAGMVGGGQRDIDVGGELPAIDRRAHRRAMREHGHQIAPAQLDRVDPDDRRSGVDQPLDQVVRLRLAGAAIGVDRHRVGEYAVHLHEHGRQIVAPAHGIAGRVGGAAGAAGGHRRAQIGDGGDVQGQKLSLAVQPQAGAGYVVAAMCRGDEILAMPGAPFHRPGEPARRPKDQDVFRIEAVLDAEAAADIGAGNLDPLGRHAQDRVGQRLADAMHALAGQQQMEGFALPVVLPDGGAMFQRGDDDAVVDQFELDDMRRRGEGGPHGGAIALLEAVGKVIRNIVPKPRNAWVHRGFGIDDAGQRIVVDRNQLGGVAGGGEAFGHDEGHGLADMARPPGGQRGAFGNQHRPRRGDLGGAGKRADPVRAKMGGIEHAEHAGDPQGRVGVDANDPGMGVGRADDLDMQLIGAIDIVGEAAASGQEPLILQTPYRLAAPFVHAQTPCKRILKDSGTDRRGRPRARPFPRRAGRATFWR